MATTLDLIKIYKELKAMSAEEPEFEELLERIKAHIILQITTQYKEIPIGALELKKRRIEEEEEYE